MRRAEVMKRLRERESDIRAFGVKKLFLYGSVARDEAGRASDVDLFFDRDEGKKLGFLELTGLMIMLEDLFGLKVDVGTRTGLHPVLRPHIEVSAIMIF